ncbi:MAG: hypothetical protein ACJAUO_002433 [Sediminicola sp.]|jgi:hypothetical protein
MDFQRLQKEKIRRLSVNKFVFFKGAIKIPLFKVFLNPKFWIGNCILPKYVYFRVRLIKMGFRH